MPDKTEEDFFIDWCYHTLQFLSCIERISVLNGCIRYFKSYHEQLSDLEFILIMDILRRSYCLSGLLGELTECGKKVSKYFFHNDGEAVFNLHELQRENLMHVDRVYCTPDWCGCGSKERNGCQNPFFMLSFYRRVENACKNRAKSELDK